MKKFLIAIAMVFAAFMLTSCKDNVGGFVYNVNVDGNAKGDVVVSFPNGNLELDGNADLRFAYSNDSTVVANRSYGEAMPLGAAMESEDENVQEFAASVNNGFDVALKDAAAGGEYHVHIYGYAKEPITGFVIAIDKSFDYPAPVDEAAE